MWVAMLRIKAAAVISLKLSEERYTFEDVYKDEVVDYWQHFTFQMRVKNDDSFSFQCFEIILSSPVSSEVLHYYRIPGSMGMHKALLSQFIHLGSHTQFTNRP